MKKGVLIIVIVVVVLLIGVGAYVFLLAPASNEPPPPVVAYYTPGEFFVTNVLDSESLVKVTITLQLNQEGKDEELKLKLPKIRNNIVFILRGLTAEEFDKPDLEQTLSKQISDSLNKDLEVDYFTNVLFSDLLVQ